MILSEQQNDFVNEVVGTRHNIMLCAVAGSGKTTTLIEAAKRCAGTTVIVAFNRGVANGIKRNLDQEGRHWRQIQAGTLHSIGLKNLQYRLKHCVVKANKVPELAALMIEQGRIDASLKPYSRIIEIMVMQAKHWAFGCDGAPAIEDVGAWFDLINHFGWLANADASLHESLILAAREVLRASNERINFIDFDDMVYLPSLRRQHCYQFANVFVDEAQDLNAAHRLLIKRIMRTGGRMIAAGDRHQSIYGYGGADTASVDKMIDHFEAREMPLTVSLRCPRSVVTFAKRFVPEIEAAPDAERGSVGQMSFDEMATRHDLKGSAILCRTTAPLIKSALRLASNGVPCHVMGSDIAKGLTGLLTHIGGSTLDVIERNLEKWLNTETTTCLRDNDPVRMRDATDKHASIGAIIEFCRKAGKGVGDLNAEVGRMFGNSEGVTLCTIHRAKGLEWSRVYWLDRRVTCPSPLATKRWELEQERNMQYVAATRSSRDLIEVSSAKEKPESADDGNDNVVRLDRFRAGLVA